MTGDELRRIRKRLGLTQQQLAQRVGLHWNSIARQERGEVTISEPLARLYRLVAASASGQSTRRRPKRKG